MFYLCKEKIKYLFILFKYNFDLKICIKKYKIKYTHV